MAQSIVRGDNAALFIEQGGEYWPYVCARSFSISTTSNMIETSITGAGKWKTFIPSDFEFNISFDGVMSLDKEATLTIYELEAKMMAQERLLAILEYNAENGRTYQKFCYFYITNVTIESSFDNVTTFRIEAQGTEPVVITQSS